MAILGFHASHEQISPSRLLEDVVLAEQAGFDAAMCSDHIEPWSERQGHAGFAWSWLGSALARTELRFGVVTAPGQRYHPAILAHASATLTEMYPGRLWVALGSGENMNEHITGEGWPPKDIRQRRLEECVSVIRRLHSGEEVTHRGLVTVERARIWDAPATPPPLIAPAVTIDTARRAAVWADGLVTINQPREHLRNMISAYRDAGGTGTTTLQVHLSWAPTESEAIGIAMDQWKNNTFAPPIPWDLPTAAYFDAVGRDVGEESVRTSVNVSASTGEHAQWLQEYLELGFDEIYLHFVGQDQQPFIEAFAAKVLPELR